MPADHEEFQDSEDSGADDPVFEFSRPSAELTPEEHQQRRRSKRFALVALAVVVVVVALAITLVSLLVDTSGGPPRTPSAAAQQWARDLVHGDSSGRRSLECTTGAQGTDVLRLVLTAATDARAGSADPAGHHAWHVPIRFLGPDGRAETSYTVDVVEREGSYLVC